MSGFLRTVRLTEMLEGADYPLTGWTIGDKLIHPPAAYTEMESWLSHFEATFPDKAKKMHDYSERQGWSQQAHDWYWPTVILGWLQKQAPSNAPHEGPGAASSRTVQLDAVVGGDGGNDGNV